MYKFTWDSQITPCISLSTPNLCFIQAPFEMNVRRGLALQSSNLEEREVLLPSPHRYLQRVLSLLNGTVGQKAKYLHTLSAAAQIPDVSSDLSPHLAVCLLFSFFLSACLSSSVSVFLFCPVPLGKRYPGCGVLLTTALLRALKEARASVQLGRGVRAIGRLSVGGRC